MIRPVFGPEIKSSDINNPVYNEMRIKIWPNPASEYIYISIGNQPLVSDIGITITDLAGRIILKSNCYNSDRLDISALPAGIYFVSVSAKSKILGTTRLVISR